MMTRKNGLKSAAVVKEVAKTHMVMIELPLGEVTEQEYLSRHVESRLKTVDQQATMKRLLRGLQASGARTNDGRPVQRPGEAVRWLLEAISGAMR